MYFSESKDEAYMALALKEARKGRFSTSPNPAVGCVLVRDGKIIGKGYHHKAGEPHAEVMALRSAAGNVEGATCYVTLEPCSHYGRTPPCALALCKAKVKRVVIAVADPNPAVSGRGIAMLRNAGIEVRVGVLAEKAFRLNRYFFRSVSSNRPFVFVKYGMSLDAKEALSDGSSKWITNALCRSDVQRLRLRADAVLTSAVTVRADNAKLNVRYAELPPKIAALVPEDKVRQPLKVIIDSHMTFASAEDRKPYDIFREGQVLLVHACSDLSEDEKYREEEPTEEGCTLLRLFVRDDGEGHACIEDLLSYLGTKQLRSVMVEAGPKLSSVFLRRALADECICYIAPKILGSSALGAFDLSEPEILKDAVSFPAVKVRRFENNIRLSLISSSAEELQRKICAAEV